MLGAAPHPPPPAAPLQDATSPGPASRGVGDGQVHGCPGGQGPPLLPPDTSGSLRPCWHGRSFLPALSPPPFFRDRFGAISCSLEPTGCSQPPDAAVSKTGAGTWRVWVPPHPRVPLHVTSVTCSIASVLLCRKQLCSLPAQQRHGGNQVGKSGGRSSPPACLCSRGISGRHRGGWGWQGLGGCELRCWRGTLPAWPFELCPGCCCPGRGVRGEDPHCTRPRGPFCPPHVPLGAGSASSPQVLQVPRVQTLA